MSAEVWHNCIGLKWNTKHLSEWLRVRGGGEYFRNSSQELKRWNLHVCINFIQFLTSSSPPQLLHLSCLHSASATSTLPEWPYKSGSRGGKGLASSVADNTFLKGGVMLEA